MEETDRQMGSRLTKEERNRLTGGRNRPTVGNRLTRGKREEADRWKKQTNSGKQADKREKGRG